MVLDAAAEVGLRDLHLVALLRQSAPGAICDAGIQPDALAGAGPRCLPLHPPSTVGASREPDADMQAAQSACVCLP